MNQLSSGVLRNTGNNAIVKQYFYHYDKAGNRTGEQVDTASTQSANNSVNQLTSQQAGGPTTFEGDLTELSTVNVVMGSTNVTASVTSNKVFKATLDLASGTNMVSVIAVDYSGNSNTATNQYRVVVAGGTTRTLAYDLNGNCTNNVAVGSTNSYAWDAVDRLVAVQTSTNRTEFAYDGMGRRVQKSEIAGGVTNTVKFVWCGMEMCEERDSSGGTVNKRFLGNGEQHNGTNYFYTRDHLGSVREMVAGDGTTVAARYDYDPYGRRTLTSGTDIANFGYAGLYAHKGSGLNLAVFRAYDADLGRWLSRDPIGMRGGMNLYAYVSNNPVRFVDTLGYGADTFNPDGSVVITTYGAGIIIGIFHLVPSKGEEFIRNALDLDHLNDQYLHCVTSCRTARAVGNSVAKDLADAKEWFDQKRGSPPEDSVSDQEGNKSGRDLGIDPCNKSKPCSQLCKEAGINRTIPREPTDNSQYWGPYN